MVHKVLLSVAKTEHTTSQRGSAATATSAKTTIKDPCLDLVIFSAIFSNDNF